MKSSHSFPLVLSDNSQGLNAYFFLGSFIVVIYIFHYILAFQPILGTNRVSWLVLSLFSHEETESQWFVQVQAATKCHQLSNFENLGLILLTAQFYSLKILSVPEIFK